MSVQNILYVESPNDEHVCYAFFKHHGIPQEFSISQKQGLRGVLDTVRIELKKADEDRLERIGILVDADDDLGARWREIQRILSRAGYTDLPPAPTPEGTIIEAEDRPTIGIWLMPDNTRPGELEDFIAALVPDDDKLWIHAGTTLQTLVERRFREQDTTKAHIHTWLAWQEDPGRPMGYAIGRHFLNSDALLATKLAG